jgi:hypothetical protein
MYKAMPFVPLLFLLDRFADVTLEIDFFPPFLLLTYSISALFKSENIDEEARRGGRNMS